jgi:hypothetical protein
LRHSAPISIASRFHRILLRFFAAFCSDFLQAVSGRIFLHDFLQISSIGRLVYGCSFSKAALLISFSAALLHSQRFWGSAWLL